MKFQKIKAGEDAGSYIVHSPVTETEILRLALQLAARRMSKGKPLTDPLQVAEHLQKCVHLTFQSKAIPFFSIDTTTIKAQNFLALPLAICSRKKRNQIKQRHQISSTSQDSALLRMSFIYWDTRIIGCLFNEGSSWPSLNRISIFQADPGSPIAPTGCLCRSASPQAKRIDT